MSIASSIPRYVGLLYMFVLFCPSSPLPLHPHPYTFPSCANAIKWFVPATIFASVVLFFNASLFALDIVILVFCGCWNLEKVQFLMALY